MELRKAQLSRPTNIELTLDWRNCKGTKRSSIEFEEFVNDVVYANGTESVRAVLKRGYKGVYHPLSKSRCAACERVSIRIERACCVELHDETVSPKHQKCSGKDSEALGVDAAKEAMCLSVPRSSHEHDKRH